MCTPTTTPDPTQVAEEQIVKAPQTMPEEETSETVLDEGGCQWRDEVVDNGHTWNPRVLPYGEVQCVTCSCKVILHKIWILNFWYVINLMISRMVMWVVGGDIADHSLVDTKSTIRERVVQDVQLTEQRYVTKLGNNFCIQKYGFFRQKGPKDCYEFWNWNKCGDYVEWDKMKLLRQSMKNSTNLINSS